MSSLLLAQALLFQGNCPITSEKFAAAWDFIHRVPELSNLASNASLWPRTHGCNPSPSPNPNTRHVLPALPEMLDIASLVVMKPQTCPHHFVDGDSGENSKQISPEF